MKTFLLTIFGIALLMSAGCVVVPEHRDHDDHWEHHDDHDWHDDHDDHH